MRRVLVISDLQAPFQHPKSLHHLESVALDYKCDTFVCIGDEVDNKFLKYLSINDPHSADQQHQLALEFMEKLYRLFPKVMVCHSNHVQQRLEDKAELSSIPNFMLKTPKEYLEAPEGWEWSDSWLVDGVKYEHGHKYKGKYPHLAGVAKNHRSTVMGHHPTLAVDYCEVDGISKFGMCVGALTIDHQDTRMGYGMKYSKKYSSEMPRGCGVVLYGERAFVEPLVTKRAA